MRARRPSPSGAFRKGQALPTSQGHAHLQISAGKSQAGGGELVAALTPRAAGYDGPASISAQLPVLLIHGPSASKAFPEQLHSIFHLLLSAPRQELVDGKQPKNITSFQKNRGSWAGLALRSFCHTHACMEYGRKENVLCLLIYTLSLCPLLKHQGQYWLRAVAHPPAARCAVPKESPCKHPREPASPTPHGWPPPATAAPAPHGCRSTARCMNAARCRSPHIARAPRAATGIARRTGTVCCNGHCTTQRALRVAMGTAHRPVPSPAAPVPRQDGRFALPRSSHGGWSAAASGNPRGRWPPPPGPLRRRLLPSSPAARSAPRRSEPSPAARAPRRPRARPPPPSPPAPPAWARPQRRVRAAGGTTRREGG